MLGGHHRLHGAIRAALREHAVEMAVHGERIGGHLLRGAGVPIANHLGDVELVACAFHDFAEADMAVTVDRIARQAAHLDFVAARHFLAVDLERDDFAVAVVEPGILGPVVAVEQQRYR